MICRGCAFVVALLGLAVLTPGCRSLGVSDRDPSAQELDDGHGMDGDRERLVRYGAAEGFVPSRLDVETGMLVVLVDESGGRLEPRFGVGLQGAAEPAASDAHAEHLAHGPADAGHAVEHDVHDHGDVPVWRPDVAGGDAGRRFIYRFDTSGYWRFHNAAAPEHAALVVSLSPAGGKLAPLVIREDVLPSASPPEMTVESYTALLMDAERVGEFMRTYGPRQTLELLRRGEVETGIDCHGSAHHLGRMAFGEYGASAAAGLTEACQSGMRHGVMEQLFVRRGIASLARDVDVLCPAASDTFGRHQCFHGVGHGVMAWTAYELGDALEICGRLGDESGRRSCYSGVFMENVVSGLSGSVGQRSTWVDGDDPHYPCNVLPERYVNDCYWYQTSQMLTVFDQDLSLVAAACREAPAVGRRSCFGSYGRDAAGFHRQNPYLVVQYCRLSGSLMHQGDCIDGAARTLFWDETQQSAGVALCAEVEEPIVAESCYQSIVNQAQAVVADLAPFCSQLPGRWRRRCLAR